MSLVQESLIDVLNRRFVCTYFNAFSGIGHDDKANEFINGRRIGYGAIFTPDGELIVSFGFDMKEFYEALSTALADHPEYAALTSAEEEVIRKAADDPDDVASQFAAAQLYAELLGFDTAMGYLDDVIEQADDDVDRNRARYLRAHYRLLSHEVQMRTQHPGGVSAEARDGGRVDVQEELLSLEGLPSDVEDDRILDLISIDTELTPRSGFYTGWRFKPDTDLDATIELLREWIEKAPESNRIGQMQFYLGLALAGQDKIDEADEVWQGHIDRHPEDRFAMLCRFHHTSYVFSPHVIGGQSSVSDPRGR